MEYMLNTEYENKYVNYLKKRYGSTRAENFLKENEN